jgi:hypothetical protein
VKEYEVQGVGSNGQPRGPTVGIEAVNKTAAKKVANDLLKNEVWPQAVTYEFKGQ